MPAFTTALVGAYDLIIPLDLGVETKPSPQINQEAKLTKKQEDTDSNIKEGPILPEVRVKETKNEAVDTKKFFKSLITQFKEANDSLNKQDKILEQAFNWIKDPKNYDELNKHDKTITSLINIAIDMKHPYAGPLLSAQSIALADNYEDIEPLESSKPPPPINQETIQAKKENDDFNAFLDELDKNYDGKYKL